MKSYKRNEYLKCPHCNNELTEGVAGDYAILSGWNSGNVSEEECYECDKTFYTQYNKNTDMIDVTA